MLRPFFVTCLLFLCCQYSVAETVSIAVQILDGKHRSQVQERLREFERANPGVSVKLYSYRDMSYVDQVEKWLVSGAGPDVIHWYGGSRMRHYAQRKLIQPLGSDWLTSDHQERFSKVALDTVTYDGEIYGVPHAVFLWAVYIRPEILQKVGLAVPENWSQMLQACKALHKQGLEAFALGSQTTWLTHAWFDYINLRLHGIEFYRALLDGKIAYTDERVIETLEYWRQMLEANCFNSNHQNFDYGQSLPRLYHGYSAMILASTHFERELPLSLADQIVVHPFPTIRKEIPAYTVSPVDVYLVPSYVTASDTLTSFLRFLADEELRGEDDLFSLHDEVGIQRYRKMLPLIKQTRLLIENSPGGIQFFDRETPIELAEYTPKVFVDFLVHRDVQRCAKELESLRLKTLAKGVYY